MDCYVRYAHLNRMIYFRCNRDWEKCMCEKIPDFANDATNENENPKPIWCNKSEDSVFF